MSFSKLFCRRNIEGVSEHFALSMEPLPNLSEQSARIGTWLLSVATQPRVEDYTYTKGAGKGSGKKFECLLVSDDSNAYCMGQFRRKGKEPGATNEFKAALEIFKKASVWKVNKISLAKSNTKYLGCSHKVLIDMNLSKFQPVLQSTMKMPQQATPLEDLSTLLQCAPGQLVDVIAFVIHVSESRTCTTFQGMRDVVDVTIMDDSGDTNAAKSEFAAWFPARTAANPCDDLKRLRDMAGSSVPVTFFNLVCQKDDDKTILKPSMNSFAFEPVSEGTKATRLIAKAEQLLATSAEDVTVVAELPVFQTRQEVDYLSTQAILTVCRLLDLARQSDAENLGISTAGAADMHLYFVKRIQDAGDFTNASDIPYRFVPCMVSGLTFYLSQKYRPELAQQMKLYYEDEFNRALTEDGSSTSTHITPQAYYPNV